MQLPTRIMAGESPGQLRRHWDELIAYLASTRMTAGNGLFLRETPSGTVIGGGMQGNGAPPPPLDFQLTALIGSTSKIKISSGTANLDGQLKTVAEGEIAVDPDSTYQFRDGVGYIILTWNGSTAGFDIVARPVTWDYNGEFTLYEEGGTIFIFSSAEPDIAGRAMLDGSYVTIPVSSLAAANGFLCLTWDGTTAAFEIVGQSTVKQPRTLIELEG